MKKVIVLGLAVGTLAIMGSCKKEYTCTCSGSNEFANYNGTTAVKAKKSEAASACAAESGYKQAGVYATCVLSE